jgi:hypothetical protein
VAIPWRQTDDVCNCLCFVCRRRLENEGVTEVERGAETDRPCQIASQCARPTCLHGLVKTGFGLWGSPNGAALAISAEFDLNSTGSPSFSVRLKPKFGDFGFQKDSGRFQASYENSNRIAATGGDRTIAVDSAEHPKPVDEDLTLNGPEVDVHAVSPNGKATNGDILHTENAGTDDAGALVLDKVESFTNGTLEKSDSFDRSRDTPEKVKRINDASPSEDDGVHFEQEAESRRNVAAGAGNRQAEESTSVVLGRQNSRLGVAAKGWRFNAHSNLPLGGWAVAKVRWQVKFGSDLFHDFRHGLRITDIRLPTLAVDKISFETLRGPRTREENDLAGLGFDYDDGTQLGRIAAMCSSMRYQIQLLHLENKFLKSTIDEWRGELPATRKPAGKSTELLKQEETALRSQLFEDFNPKPNGGSNGNGKSNGHSKGREGRYTHSDSQSGQRHSNGKGTTSTGEEFTITKDPSEELQKAILNATGGGH